MSLADFTHLKKKPFLVVVVWRNWLVGEKWHVTELGEIGGGDYYCSDVITVILTSHQEYAYSWDLISSNTF